MVIVTLTHWICWRGSNASSAASGNGGYRSASYYLVKGKTGRSAETLGGGLWYIQWLKLRFYYFDYCS